MAAKRKPAMKWPRNEGGGVTTCDQRRDALLFIPGGILTRAIQVRMRPLEDECCCSCK